MQERSILALDLGTRCGFATRNNSGSKNDHGWVSFEPHKGEVSAWRYIYFNVWLYKFKNNNLDLVVFERPLPNHFQRATSEMAFGFSTRVEEFCARERITCKSVHNSTLKKHATGNGKSDKSAMLRFGKSYWPHVTDHNEMDALWLLHYAQTVLAA